MSESAPSESPFDGRTLIEVRRLLIERRLEVGLPLVLPAERIGSEIAGKYRLDRVIGQGGMGAVLAGVHLHTGRSVAVKLLHPDPSGNRQMLPRFRQEARAAAALDHPNVVQILDVGETDDGAAFMVQELLRGRTLKSHLAERGRLSSSECGSILLPLMHALAAAHAQGIVHRDLKPDNVFMAEDATGRVTPKLLDFGIAKVAGSSLATAHGVIVGTPEYMSPEQACGASDVGPPSDVWSIGVIAYECLAGALPFETSDDAWATLNTVRTCAPIPLRERAPWLSDRLCAVVDRALDRDPESRWPGIAGLSTAFAGAAGTASDEIARLDPLADTVVPDATTIDVIPPIVLASYPMPATAAWNDSGVEPRKPARTTPWSAAGESPMAGDPTASLPAGESALVAANVATPASTPFAWAPARRPPTALNRWGLVVGVIVATSSAAGLALVLWRVSSNRRTQPSDSSPTPAAAAPIRTLVAAPRAPMPPAPIESPIVPSAPSAPTAPQPPVAAAASLPRPLATKIVAPPTAAAATPNPRSAQGHSASRAARPPTGVALVTRLPPPPLPAAVVRTPNASTPTGLAPQPRAPSPASRADPVVIDNGIRVPR